MHPRGPPSPADPRPEAPQRPQQSTDVQLQLEAPLGRGGGVAWRILPSRSDRSGPLSLARDGPREAPPPPVCNLQSVSPPSPPPAPPPPRRGGRSGVSPEGGRARPASEEGARNCTASGVPRETCGSGDRASPQISAPARPPRPAGCSLLGITPVCGQRAKAEVGPVGGRAGVASGGGGRGCAFSGVRHGISRLSDPPFSKYPKECALHPPLAVPRLRGGTMTRFGLAPSQDKNARGRQIGIWTGPSVGGLEMRCLSSHPALASGCARCTGRGGTKAR